MPAIYLIIYIVLLTLIDQLSKYLIMNCMYNGEVISIIPHVLQFRYLQNRGAAFGMMSGKTIFLSVFTLAIIIICSWLLFTERIEGKLKQSAMVLVLAGGIGNLIDRIFRHYVVDFMEFTFVDFAVFNFADCCVTIGAALLIIAILVDMGKESKSA